MRGSSGQSPKRLLIGHTVWRCDERGRVMVEERWIDGQLYTTYWSYDAMDRVVSLTYPDGEVVSYAYNNQLALATMSGTSGYVTGTGYNALNKPTQVVLSNGRVTDIQYCWLEWAGKVPFGAIAWIKTTKAGLPNLQDLQYTYDNVGNPTQVHDPRNGETVNYGYDELDRLLTASAPINGSYSYNQIGNVLSKTEGGVTHSYQYNDPYHKHAPSMIDSVEQAYDANGNLDSHWQLGEVYKYDAENRLVKLTRNGVYVARFAYDGDGKRVKRVDNYGSVHYIAPHYERNVGNGEDTTEVVTKFYYAQLGPYRRLIAVKRGNDLRYVHSDHLGGTNILSDLDGNEVGALRYHSYGGTRVQSGSVPTDKLFTGQTLDTSSGLYYYGARYYDAALGRFVQPDTVVPEPGNPQSLNRYSYVLNNPLRYTDPTGYQGEEEYTVQPGDTLWDIAERYLGDGSRYGELAEANNIADPSRIYPGQTLTIPGLGGAGPSPMPQPEAIARVVPGPQPTPPPTSFPTATPSGLEPPLEHGPQLAQPVGWTPGIPSASLGQIEVNWGKAAVGGVVLIPAGAALLFTGIALVSAVPAEVASGIGILAAPHTLGVGWFLATSGWGVMGLGAYLVVTSVQIRQPVSVSAW